WNPGHGTIRLVSRLAAPGGPDGYGYPRGRHDRSAGDGNDRLPGAADPHAERRSAEQRPGAGALRRRARWRTGSDAARHAVAIDRPAAGGPAPRYSPGLLQP